LRGERSRTNRLERLEEMMRGERSRTNRLERLDEMRVHEKDARRFKFLNLV
jgi:ferritin